MMRPRLVDFARPAIMQGQVPVLLTLLPPLFWQMLGQGTALGLRLLVIGAVVLFWQLLFLRTRRQDFGLEGVSMAVLVALLVPEAAPLWQLALGSTFGVVIGLLIFGGQGRNLLHPAVAALAFLMFSFVDGGYRTTTELPILTLVPALLVLLASGQVNWRVLAGAIAGFAGLAWLQGVTGGNDVLSTGLFWLVLVFLVADPVASASTNWGRLGYGLLFGVLTVLFLQAGTAQSALVFAALTASIFAPLVDRLVIAINAGWRARRHG